MNSNLMIFENPEFGAVRSILIDGDPWFVGKTWLPALVTATTEKPCSTMLMLRINWMG